VGRRGIMCGVAAPARRANSSVRRGALHMTPRRSERWVSYLSNGTLACCRVRLPFAPPLEPMLSKAADALPGGDGWQFEPKWDGFRTLVFCDGDEVVLQSRDGKPMNRYFPELVGPLIAAL